MASLTTATSSIRAVFSLDVIVSALALFLAIIAVILALTRHKRRNDQYHGLSDSSSTPLKSTLATHFFLVPSLLFLCIEYASLAAIVGLQLHLSASTTITTGYSYQALFSGTRSDDTIEGLSYTQQFAAIVFTTCLNGAVWLHSSHITSNGTGIGQPSTTSKIWNTVILSCIVGTGFAAWGWAISLKGTGISTYASAVQIDEVARALHVTFRCIVIFSSLSVAVEVVRKWTELDRNGTPGVSCCYFPILHRILPSLVIDAQVLITIYRTQKDLSSNASRISLYL